MKLFAAVVLSLLTVPAAAQIQSVPVQFAKGASSATIKGSLKGSVTRDYVVNARAGQTLTVDFKPTNASAYMNILPPGTEEAIHIGSGAGNRFSGPLTASGNHRIRVYLMRNAARRNEATNYVLTVGVTGYAAATRPGDALVAGTPYNATAQIRCLTEPGKPMTSCNAGVKRMADGTASVHVTTPDGGARVIRFKGNTATGTDSTERFSASREGDDTIVRAGTTEIYIIPDAFVTGG
jgi:hypothetical protein